MVIRLTNNDCITGFPSYLRNLKLFTSLAIAIFGTYHVLNTSTLSSEIRTNESRHLQSLQSTNDEQMWPSIVWLVSYPNSGSSYVRDLVQQVSKTTTATNYAVDRTGHAHLNLDFQPNPSIVVSDNPELAFSRTGPYRMTNDAPFPDRYILTETHCTGYCLNCIRDAYVYQNTYVKGWEDFHRGCATGYHSVDGRLVEVRYDTGVAQRFIHLVRHPLDNIVARFFDEKEKFEVNGRDWAYSMNRDGFRQWCDDISHQFDEYENKWTDHKIKKLSRDIPCHKLFYQYVLWHNSVYDALGQYGRQLETHIVPFEDFETNMMETTSTLLKFLELPNIENPPPFSRSSYIDDFFPVQRERIMISSFIKVLASEKVWATLKRYLPDPALWGRLKPIGSALSPVHFGSWPQVAWLMTFPNSGTFYTTQLVRVASQRAVATNYAHEVSDARDVPNFARTGEGPFRCSRRKFPDEFILTKTHCGGHCIDCFAKDKKKSFEDFLNECGKVWKVEWNHEDRPIRIKDFYTPSTAKKVVHLIRNPFDNVVANFHYTYKFHKAKNDVNWNYTYNKEGFLEWCRDMDTNSKLLKAKVYSIALQTMLENVPCHEVFYQYIRWHNHALAVPIELNIPSLVIHYEDYQHNLEETLNKLLEFLGLTNLGTVTPFSYNEYSDYFSEEQRMAIVKFMRAIASNDTNDIMKRYY